MYFETSIILGLRFGLMSGFHFEVEVSWFIFRGLRYGFVAEVQG